MGDLTLLKRKGGVDWGWKQRRGREVELRGEEGKGETTVKKLNK